MSETVIFMLGCATSRIPSLDLGCVSIFWMTDGEGHRAALTFPVNDHQSLGLIKCAGCGFEPEEEDQIRLRRVLREYLDLANLAEQEPGVSATSPCHIIVRAEEN